jgi:hypothetical protein
MILLAEGRLGEAAAAARAARTAEQAVYPQLNPVTWWMELEPPAAAEDAEALEEVLAERDALAPVERTPWIESLNDRFQGRLLALRGDRDGAAELLARAAARYGELQTLYLRAMVLVEQAELGVDDPAPLLAEAREIFERLGAKPWLERIDAVERAVAV